MQFRSRLRTTDSYQSAIYKPERRMDIRSILSARVRTELAGLNLLRRIRLVQGEVFCDHNRFGRASRVLM